MKIFLDFDDTLFDTKSFFFGLRDVFVINGVSPELFQLSYQIIKTGSDSKPLGYSSDTHIEYLQNFVALDVVALRQALAVYMSDTRKFLYDDVENFLKTLKKYGHTPYILSFGDKEYQMAKIGGTNIAPYIEKSIITNIGKAEALHGEIDANMPAWFFDDKIHFIESVRRAFPKVRTVLVRRAGGHQEEEPNEFCDYTVKDLIEGQKILSEYS